MNENNLNPIIIIATITCLFIIFMLLYLSSKQWATKHVMKKKFTKAIPVVGQLRYQDRLKALKLKSLEHRLIADICLLYKIINNLTSTYLKNHIHFTNYSSTRGHQFKRRSNVCAIDNTKYFFTNRIINIWNNLPNSIVSSIT